MIRRRLLLISAVMLPFAAAVLGPVEAFAAGGSPGKEPGRAKLTMEELEVRGYGQAPVRLFLPPVPDRFYRSPVRFDLLREELASPILPSEIGDETKRMGGHRGDDE